jgi:predicted dehydrogenase
MYRDFVRAVRDGVPPEMSLERAMDDQRLMDQIYAGIDRHEPAVAVSQG